MPETLRVLLIHGIGGIESRDVDWANRWHVSISDALKQRAPTLQLETQPFAYDALFGQYELGAADYLEVLGELAASAIAHAGEPVFRGRGVRGDLSGRFRDTVGMIARWVKHDALRARLRTALAQRIRSEAPHVVCAHSMGSLIAYDTLRDRRFGDALRDSALVTFGSQIGNVFIRSQWAGSLGALPVRRWFHLWNEHDCVFAASLARKVEQVEELEVPFEDDFPLHHDAIRYLDQPDGWAIWDGARGAARGLAGLEALRPKRRPTARQRPSRARRRALLVGINEYPDPKDRLEGCLNDVFEMSAVLQEGGWDAEDIRVVLDRRATAAGIRERLAWLLEGARDGDERVLFYSGHGARMPGYAPDETVDRMDECLVPWDFDWSRERAIRDDDFAALYAQLPYGVVFHAIFDCCHAGGMARDGGPKTRGLDPPDDIRHRALAWDARAQMWSERELRQLRAFAPTSRRRPAQSLIGASGDTYRLGRGMRLRRLEKRRYDRERARLRHEGPFMPVILQACGEAQVALEYKHGTAAFGAFTFALARQLRAQRGRPTFPSLRESVGRTLARLGYEQRPELVCPRVDRAKPITWTPRRRP